MNDVKFIERNHEIFEYVYHKPTFSSAYVREVGAYLFQADYAGSEVEVTLMTGESLMMGDYDFPNPDYEVTSVTIDGVAVDMSELPEQDSVLYEAIAQLPKRCTYNDNLEDYEYICEIVEDEEVGVYVCSLDELDAPNVKVIKCQPKEPHN